MAPAATYRGPATLTSSSNRHGAQGEYNTPSDAALESEFNTEVVEDAIKIVLAKGEIQQNEVCTTVPAPFSPAFEPVTTWAETNREKTVPRAPRPTQRFAGHLLEW